MRRFRALPSKGDSGMGLPELLVSMAVGGIVLLALGTTFGGTLKTTGVATTRISNTAELRPGLDTMARRLRLAVPPKTNATAFEVAAPRSVRFYSSLDTPGDTTDKPPTLVEYTILPGCLQEKRTTPTGISEATWSWTPGASTKTTCLARGAVNADGSDVFDYFPSGAVTAPELGGSAGVAAADLHKILSVQMTAKVKSSATSPVPATSATTRVTLVNLLPLS